MCKIKDFYCWLQFLFRKKYANYKLFRLNDCGTVAYGMDSQGIDVYDNRYLFQGSDQGGKIASLVVVDLQTKKILAEFNLGDIMPGCHMNNINIGQKLTDKSKFPVLYISECRGEHKCYVISINDDLSGVNLIQTIKFTSPSHHGGSKNSFDWFVYGEYIYTFGSTGVNGEVEIVKFPKPNIKNKKVSYTDKHVLNSFKLNNCYVFQGSKVIDGKLYAPFGFGTKEIPTYLKIIDLKRAIVETNIKIENLGEIEAVAPYQDGLIASNNAINPTYTFIKLKNA